MLACAGAALLCAIIAAPASAVSPLYCDGALDDGATAVVTDVEHPAKDGDPALPAGVTQRSLTVDGITTRVIESGPSTAEEAVVFIHGNPGSARDFDGLVASTGRFARAIAFDIPGLGHADDGPTLDYSTTGAARFIGRVIAQLGVRRVHLVLHDLGGIWGLQWAAGQLAAVRSVTLIDTGVLIGYIGHPLGITWTVPVLGEAEMAAITRAAFKVAIGAQDPLPDRYLDRMYDDFDRPTRCAVLDYYRSIGSTDAIGRRQAALLAPANLPALVIWGARDAFVPDAEAYRQTAAFPDAQIDILPGSGHWPQLDAPQRTQQLVTAFLRDRVHSPELILRPLAARAGQRSLSVRVSVVGAPSTPGVRLSVLRDGRPVSAVTPARTADGVARRVAIRLRSPLRRGGGYTLRAQSGELATQTRGIHVR